MSKEMRTNGELILSGPKFQNQRAEFAKVLGNGAQGSEELTVKLRRDGKAKVHAQMWFDLSDCDVRITNSIAEDDGQVGEWLSFYFHAPSDQHVGIMINVDQACALRALLNNYLAAVDAVTTLKREEIVEVEG